MERAAERGTDMVSVGDGSPQEQQTAVTDEVRLRPLSIRDKANVRRWMADPELVRFTVQVPSPDCAPHLPYATDAADRYLRSLVTDPARRSFAICTGERHVGNVGLKDYNAAERTAECFVEIGEREVRGRGVARRAMTQLLDLGLLHMGLVEISLGVFEFNAPALRLYRRLGFVPAGPYGWHWADGRYWEVQRMRIDPDQWAAAHPDFT
jgi:RimJ/RimL family protein N-acetyltransferase